MVTIMGVSVKGECIPNISHSVAIFRGKVTFSTMQFGMHHIRNGVLP